MELGEFLADAQAKLEATSLRWNTERQAVVESSLDAIMRSLHREGIDGSDYIKHCSRADSLRPLHQERERLAAEIQNGQDDRLRLLADLHRLQRRRLSELRAALKKINKNLAGLVLVTVDERGSLNRVWEIIRAEAKTKPEAWFQGWIGREEEFDLIVFAQTCRDGRDALIQRFRLPRQSADAIALVGRELARLVEEVDLQPVPRISLNIGSENEPHWQELSHLSTGQRATALLLLLLLEQKFPLIIDQPEDDLDNRFVHDGVLPRIRSAKQARQLIFSTHNANIPVIGDAELVMLMEGSFPSGGSRPKLRVQHRGAIDMPETQRAIETTLEGGKKAFELRRRKYGYGA
jgi:hypothetical protein